MGDISYGDSYGDMLEATLKDIQLRDWSEAFGKTFGQVVPKKEEPTFQDIVDEEVCKLRGLT